jgi:hypothetical protein
MMTDQSTDIDFPPPSYDDVAPKLWLEPPTYADAVNQQNNSKT